ncbi:MAG: flagellin [Lachnospiraceae bacterium]
MRITSNMIMNNTLSNLNSNRLNVNSLNSQMSSQKKISRPSEDPVIALRSLRLNSALNEINQYYEKNIPDAQSWMDVTETALTNMNKILTSVRAELVKGANGDLTSDDRNTILNSIVALQQQMYAEGNSDYAGRTVFTGYRTNSQLTFMDNENSTSYDIEQRFDSTQISSANYYSGSVDVPTSAAEIANTGNIGDVIKTSYDRLRMGYDDISELNSFSYSYNGQTATFVQDATNPNLYTATDPSTGSAISMTVYENEDEWSAASADGSKSIGDNDMVFIKTTGDLIMGQGIADIVKENDASFAVSYNKTGFTKGELRPEYYYDCTDVTNASNPLNYQKYTYDPGTDTYVEIYQDINYTIAPNQSMTVNIQASDVFNMNIFQDMQEMTDAVKAATAAQDKVDAIQKLIDDDSNSDQLDELNTWLAAAQKESDYAEDNLQTMFSNKIGDFDAYMADVNLSITELGTRGDRLSMTETRMSNQQLNVEELKSKNEDRDISEIVIEYTAAYNAYEAALQAAAKIEKQSLLNYI